MYSDAPLRFMLKPLRAMTLPAWLIAFFPARVAMGRRERLASVVGAGLGIGLTLLGCYLLPGSTSPWLVAPIGASAVLVFAAPASPLAQPWSLLGGNVLSALAGIGVAQFSLPLGLAAALAVALAIAVMLLMRCLHPPGGAMALSVVLAHAAGPVPGLAWALSPVAVNSVLLMLVALLFNNAVRRSWPHRTAPAPVPHATDDPLPQARLAITAADFEAALATHGELLDITRADLQQIVFKADEFLQRRRMAGIRCSDIMARDVICISPDASLARALSLLEAHRVKLLPVVDASQRLQGVLTFHDIYLAQVPRPGSSHADTPARLKCVADIMVRRPVSVRPDQSVAELASLFTDAGLHHLPVLDAQQRVVGMVSQSDFVAALLSLLQHQPVTAA